MITLKIEDILQSFYEISGMDIAIVNSRNKIIARRYSGALYCANIHKSQKCMDICLESDRCNIAKAYESKGLHIYKCPFGVYEALMPINKNDEIVAYVFVGMGIEDDEESVKELPALSLGILESSLRYLKPGGVMVFSTCTILDEENCEVFTKLLSRHPELSAVDFELFGLKSLGGMLSLLPHKHGTDGFFIAKMRKDK